MKSINITDETKVVFDVLQAEMCSLMGHVVSQDEALNELIKAYNEQKVKP